MNIRSGTVLLSGDQTSAVNGYIASGLIAAYGGAGTLSVDYNVTTSGKTTITAVEPNLVVNGSFETNTASWTLAGSAARSTAAAADGGVASLRITTAGSSAKQLTIPIAVGTTYDISVQVYVAARTAGMVVFDTWDQYDAAGQGQFTFNVANGGWTNCTGSFTATNSSVTLRMFSDSSFAGTVYFDQVELKVH
jgi:hypothetical protein